MCVSTGTHTHTINRILHHTPAGSSCCLSGNRMCVFAEPMSSHGKGESIKVMACLGYLESGLTFRVNAGNNTRVSEVDSDLV